MSRRRRLGVAGLMAAAVAIGLLGRGGGARPAALPTAPSPAPSATAPVPRLPRSEPRHARPVAPLSTASEQAPAGDPDRVACPNPADRWGRVLAPLEVEDHLATSTGGVALVPWSGGDTVTVQFPGVRSTFQRGAEGCRLLSTEPTVTVMGTLATEDGAPFYPATVVVCGAVAQVNWRGEFTVQGPVGACDLTLRHCSAAPPSVRLTVPADGALGTIRLPADACGAYEPPREDPCAETRRTVMEVDWMGATGTPEQQQIFDDLAEELLAIRGCTD